MCAIGTKPERKSLKRRNVQNRKFKHCIRSTQAPSQVVDCIFQKHGSHFLISLKGDPVTATCADISRIRVIGGTLSFIKSFVSLTRFVLLKCNYRVGMAGEIVCNFFRWFSDLAEKLFQLCRGWDFDVLNAQLQTTRGSFSSGSSCFHHTPDTKCWVRRSFAERS